VRHGGGHPRMTAGTAASRRLRHDRASRPPRGSVSVHASPAGSRSSGARRTLAPAATRDSAGVQAVASGAARIQSGTAAPCARTFHWNADRDRTPPGRVTPRTVRRPSPDARRQGERDSARPPRRARARATTARGLGSRPASGDGRRGRLRSIAAGTKPSVRRMCGSTLAPDFRTARRTARRATPGARSACTSARASAGARSRAHRTQPSASR
jgi:hypothetical protein